MSSTRIKSEWRIRSCGLDRPIRKICHLIEVDYRRGQFVLSQQIAILTRLIEKEASRNVI